MGNVSGVPPPPSRFQITSLFMHGVGCVGTVWPTCTSSQDFNSGSPSDVFCLAQLILQREEKNRLSRILPHSPFCVTGELFFVVCEMTHFFFIQSPTKDHTTMPRPLPPIPRVSHFTQIDENVIIRLDSSATKTPRPLYPTSVMNKLLLCYMLPLCWTLPVPASAAIDVSPTVC